MSNIDGEYECVSGTIEHTLEYGVGDGYYRGISGVKVRYIIRATVMLQSEDDISYSQTVNRTGRLKGIIIVLLTWSNYSGNQLTVFELESYRAACFSSERKQCLFCSNRCGRSS